MNIINNLSFDLVVVGAGPGGYVAAIRASQLGFKVAIVEREELGGICLNWGCIPTKTLLHTASMISRIATAEDMGIVLSGKPAVSLPKAVARSRAVAERLRHGVQHLMAKNNVTVFRGAGSLKGPKCVKVTPASGTPYELDGDKILLATGAKPRELKTLPFDQDRVWSYRDALIASVPPSSMLVVGAGAIGMEFATFYATIGTAVTMAEARDTVLPGEDPEISAFVLRAFRARGIEVLLSTSVLSASGSERGVAVTLTTGAQERVSHFDKVLVCAGVVANVAGLGLGSTRVRTDKSDCIVTHGCGATDEPSVFAIGDVAGAPMLAHKASHEALVCIEAMKTGDVSDGANHLVPACTFCEPQVASVGLNEAAAMAVGREIKVGRYPFAANGKALAIGDSDGFVKTIFDKLTGELLGVHMVGPDVTELIHSAVLACGMEATEEDLMRTIFPHPTLSEALVEATLAAFGRALHI